MAFFFVTEVTQSTGPDPQLTDAAVELEQSKARMPYTLDTGSRFTATIVYKILLADYH